MGLLKWLGLGRSREPRVGDLVRLTRYPKGSEHDAMHSRWHVVLIAENGVYHLTHLEGGRMTARRDEIEVVQE